VSARPIQIDFLKPERRLDQIATDSMIDEAIRKGAYVVFNLSGGKDCGAVSAMTQLYLDAQGHPRERRMAIHADLGRAEWPHTPAQVEAQAHALGLRLVVVRAASGDLVDRFENRWALGLADYQDMRLYHLRGPWSSPNLKFCQSEKKIQVMGPHLARALKGETIINVVGIRREESTGRKNTEVAKVDTRFAEPGNRFGTRMLLWHPGVELLVGEVFDANLRHSIPLAESYSRGATRHSCALCIMGSLNDLGVGARGHPWLYRHYVSMEASSTFSFQAGRWLADIAPDLLDGATLQAISLAKQRAIDRKEIEARMPAQHRYVKGWPLYVPTVPEAMTILDARRRILAEHEVTSPFDTVGAIRDRFAELKSIGDARRAKKAAA
jgi:3'-phosphoadenosine 5'-phosphosulfate sulfotransferase (PAPS reductase)/FAD synthetase